MKILVCLLSGVIFGIGLALSGMIDPAKVKGFLSVGFSDWNPALMFELGSAAPVYFLFYTFLRLRKKNLVGTPFHATQDRPLDRNLIMGSILFGIGWGIAGICPGPAIVHLAFLAWNFAIFIFTMIAGFELRRIFRKSA